MVWSSDIEGDFGEEKKKERKRITITFPVFTA
jgi:hypothetical protein